MVCNTSIRKKSAPKNEDNSPREGFKPIAIKSPKDHPVLFRIRSLIDIQLASIIKYLRPALGQLSGKVLDVGAGESPWRDWLPQNTSYLGIDIRNAHEFGMERDRQDIVYYDGDKMPFVDHEFNCVLCIEVLEHAEDPQLLVSEMARVLRAEGTMLLTVPWSARLHHLPHDYHRFTRERLRVLLAKEGFTQIEISERGNDIGVIANKLTVLTVRLLRPGKLSNLYWTLPLGLLCGALAVLFIAAAHLSDALGMGSREDPLGYFVRAKKRSAEGSLHE